MWRGFSGGFVVVSGTAEALSSRAGIGLSVDVDELVDGRSTSFSTGTASEEAEVLASEATSDVEGGGEGDRIS